MTGSPVSSGGWTRWIISSLGQKISRHFIWTVGIQVAVLLAVVAALAGH